jgi:hypothetical protein
MKNEKLLQSVFSKKTFAEGYNSPWSILIACCLLILPLLFVACKYDNEPALIYDPTVSSDVAGKPTITSVTPATEAVAGVREITITGLNLKTGTDTNWVFIGGTRAIIKDLQNTSITIYRPALSSDNYSKTIDLNITDPKMLALSAYSSYKVESPGAIIGDYTPVSAIGAVEFDKQENLYAISNKNIYQTDFTGNSQRVVLNPIALLSSDYNAATGLGFGPGANARNLFIAVGKNYIARVAIYDTINRNNKPVKLTVPGAVSQLEFDGNGKVYVAGAAGDLYVADSSVGMSSAPVFTQISGYSGGMAKKIRVTSQYIYIADSLRVWRSPITSSSFVGELLVDVTTHSELSGCFITSMEVDENGNVFFTVRNNPRFSLFYLENNGSVTPFYSDPGILPNTVDKLVWGNDDKGGPGVSYLYLISSSYQSSPGTYASGRVYRLTLNRNGAPYQGRNFVK